MMNGLWPLRSIVRWICMFAAGFFSLTMLTGCLVAGVSSNGGAFLWPGGLGLVVVIVLGLFLLRRR